VARFAVLVGWVLPHMCVRVQAEGGGHCPPLAPGWELHAVLTEHGLLKAVVRHDIGESEELHFLAPLPGLRLPVTLA
jgi:hypothetical protein